MHEPPENIRRRVIPRWRTFASTPKEELTFAPASTIPVGLNQEFSTLATQWRRFRTLNNAAELLYAGTLGLDKSEVYEAAQFIIELPSAPAGLKRLAAVRLSVAQPAAGAEVGHRETSFQIRTLRKNLAVYPRNPIAHIELARAYVSAGETPKADKHVRAAIQLAPNSRFVLRSAARFDVHRGELDRSLHAMAEMAKHDAWIAATYVSISDLANKPLPKLKPIRNLLNATHEPSHFSELAAALGTLELKSSGIRKARKYFQLSSVAPNENVIAQLFWVAKNYGTGFDPHLLEQAQAYEARAQSAAVAQSWSKAIDSCWQWLDDEPFSARPTYEGGFIASEILQDFKTAQEFANRGLVSNPKAVGLMNNLAYSLIMDSNLKDGAEWLRRAKQLAEVDDRQQLIVQATEGLLRYRMGDGAQGARLYMDAIFRAYQLKADSLMHLAYIHFCYEELRIGHSPPFLSPQQLESVFIRGRVSKTVKAVFERIVSPMLQAHRNYGLLDVGYSPAAPIFERALVSGLTDKEPE